MSHFFFLFSSLSFSQKLLTHLQTENVLPFIKWIPYSWALTLTTEVKLTSSSEAKKEVFMVLPHTLQAFTCIKHDIDIVSSFLLHFFSMFFLKMKNWRHFCTFFHLGRSFFFFQLSFIKKENFFSYFLKSHRLSISEVSMKVLIKLEQVVSVLF